MNFNINENTTRKNIDFFRAGINEPVKLVNIAREPLSTKEDATDSLTVTAFHFVNKSGATFRGTLFDYDPARSKNFAETYERTHKFDNEEKGYVKGERVTPEQAMKMDLEDYQNKIMDILTAFVPRSEVNITATTVDELVEQMNAIIGDKKDTTYLRLALEYRGKYLGFPRYGIFLENVKTTPSRIKLDKLNLVKDTPDEETGHDAPDTNSEFTGAADDLPF